MKSNCSVDDTKTDYINAFVCSNFYLYIIDVFYTMILICYNGTHTKIALYIYKKRPLGCICPSSRTNNYCSACLLSAAPLQ